MLRLGTEVWVIDLASTNGVSRDGARLFAEVLRDTDRIPVSYTHLTKVHVPRA